MIPQSKAPFGCSASFWTCGDHRVFSSSSRSVQSGLLDSYFHVPLQLTCQTGHPIFGYLLPFLDAAIGGSAWQLPMGVPCFIRVAPPQSRKECSLFGSNVVALGRGHLPPSFSTSDGSAFYRKKDRHYIPPSSLPFVFTTPICPPFRKSESSFTFVKTQSFFSCKPPIPHAFPLDVVDDSLYSFVPRSRPGFCFAPVQCISLIWKG